MPVSPLDSFLGTVKRAAAFVKQHLVTVTVDGVQRRMLPEAFHVVIVSGFNEGVYQAPQDWGSPQFHESS